jgi:hypothetical protein
MAGVLRFQPRSLTLGDDPERSTDPITLLIAGFMSSIRTFKTIAEKKHGSAKVADIREQYPDDSIESLYHRLQAL